MIFLCAVAAELIDAGSSAQNVASNMSMAVSWASQWGFDFAMAALAFGLASALVMTVVHFLFS
jgi:hypothetical protein